VYTSGVWNVKQGKEHDFARGWQASVDRMSLELPGIVFRLLRDEDRPSRFVTVVGPWRNREQYEAARSSEPFQQTIASTADMLESYEISVYDLVAEVS
jgi:quinol monooxygenase YgiN